MKNRTRWGRKSGTEWEEVKGESTEQKSEDKKRMHKAAESRKISFSYFFAFLYVYLGVSNMSIVIVFNKKFTSKKLSNNKSRLFLLCLELSCVK